jgi:hypothetical protein
VNENHSSFNPRLEKHEKTLYLKKSQCLVLLAITLFKHMGGGGGHKQKFLSCKNVVRSTFGIVRNNLQLHAVTFSETHSKRVTQASIYKESQKDSIFTRINR